jgi:hypothetical protein
MTRQRASSTVLLDVDTAARQALAFDPALMLAGPPQRLLDEWSAAAAIAGWMASRCCRWERWGRDQQEPKPDNPRQTGPMSADLLHQVGSLIG